MFTFADKQCCDPAKLYDECVEAGLPTGMFAGVANSFRVNAGETPSAGAVLMLASDFLSISQTAAAELHIQDSKSNLIQFKQLYITSAVRVAAGALGDPNGVYLVRIADARCRLAMVPINKAYNLDKPDGTGTQTATQNSGVNWTWAQVGSDLWTAVGLGTWPGLSITPNGTPSNLNYYGGYALPALVSFLNRVGCELRVDNITGAFGVVQIGGGTTSTYFTSWDKADQKFNGQAYTPDATNRPEKVRVRFTRLPAPTTGDNPYYTVDVSLTASTGVLAGSVAIVDDDMAALGSTGTPTNSAALATRAAERGADWERRYTNAARMSVLQYREYLSAARLAVGERRAGAVFEDTGDGYTTESFAFADRLFERLQFKTDTFIQGAAVNYPDGQVLGATVSLTGTSGTYTDIISQNLPAGTYMIWYSVAGILNTALAGAYLQPRIFDGTGSFALSACCFTQAVALGVIDGTAAIVKIVKGSSFTLKLQVARVFTGTVNQSDVIGNSSAWGTFLAWQKIA